MAFETELIAALEAAQEAGKLQLNRFASLSYIEIKEDRSPVTEIDRDCEQLIIDHLSSKFPSDGFLCEETGKHDGLSGRKWIIDPLDGTRPYIRGIPTHSVLIALESQEQLSIGVIHLPALGLTCWASKGKGAFLNGSPIHVSNVDNMRKAMGSALGFVEKAELEESNRLLRLMRSWDYAYGFMDAYSYVCAASGKLDICVNLLDKPWDCAAAACIISEAGGKFTDIHGRSSIYNGSILFSNGLLHDQALEYLK